MKMQNAVSIRVPSVVAFIIACAACRQQQAIQPPVKQDVCSNYVSLTASLAEQTVNCTGTIGPNSFELDAQGRLNNKFQACSAGLDTEREATMTNIHRLLRLQNFPDRLPKLRECLSDRFQRWSELFARTGLKTCPNWTPKVTIGDPASEGVEGARAAAQQHGKMQPKLRYVPAVPKGTVPGTPFFVKGADPKGRPISELQGPTPDMGPSPDQRLTGIRVPTQSVTVYEINFPIPEPACADPAVCAAQCAAFLPGFVLAASGTRVAADPAQWYRNRMWTRGCDVVGHDDPWCSPDYVHQMSVNSTVDGGTVPPGDEYGHPNRGRFGEHCLKWFPGTPSNPAGYDYETDLVLQCMDPSQTDCLSHCGN